MGKLLAFSLPICCIILLHFAAEPCKASFIEEDSFEYFPTHFQTYPGRDKNEDSSISLSSSEEEEGKIGRDESEDSSKSLSSEEEDERKIDSWRKHNHHHHRHIVHLNICKCHHDSCACCFQVLKHKICDNFTLVYPSNDSQSLTIDFSISINNSTLFSDKHSLAKLPVLCYRAANVGICGKLVTKTVRCENEKRVELCGQVQLKFNSEVLAHMNVFCVKLRKEFKVFDENEEDEEAKTD